MESGITPLKERMAFAQKEASRPRLMSQLYLLQLAKAKSKKTEGEPVSVTINADTDHAETFQFVHGQLEDYERRVPALESSEMEGEV